MEFLCLAFSLLNINEKYAAPNSSVIKVISIKIQWLIQFNIDDYAYFHIAIYVQVHTAAKENFSFTTNCAFTAH